MIDIYLFRSGCAMCQETKIADMKNCAMWETGLKLLLWKCRKRPAQEKRVTEHASFEAVREIFDDRLISRGL